MPTRSLTLTQLEAQLSALNTRRRQVIAAMQAALRDLTTGTIATSGRAQSKARSTSRPRRRFSAAARARLSRLAKERWAKAKKAGKTRLG